MHYHSHHSQFIKVIINIVFIMVLIINSFIIIMLIIISMIFEDLTTII
jgi:hypothetical protein